MNLLSLASSFVFTIITISLISCGNGTQHPTTTITQGMVLGNFAKSRSGRPYFEFLGIPYGLVENPFDVAKPPRKITEIFNATAFGQKCLQFHPIKQSVIGDMECLFINIYRPAEVSGRKLPVMTFIHGGAFTYSGADDYNGSYFMDYNVILVTFNYRLGALGFLNPGSKNYVANLGMKDQVQALRWIRDNIESFGGDKNRVTLFGDSTGSASVSYHILSPMSRGLFNGAILQSGNALCPWALVKQPKKVATRLAHSIGCHGNDVEQLTQCLKTKNPKDIIKAQAQLSGWDEDPIIPFAPSVENSENNSTPNSIFLPNEPYEIWNSGNFNKVPMISGVNSAEGATLYAAVILNNTELTEEFNRNWIKLSPYALSFDAEYGQDQMERYLNGSKGIILRNESDVDSGGEDVMYPRIEDVIKEYYFGNESISLLTRKNFTNLFSDRNFYQCNREGAILHGRYSPVYLYYMAQTGKLSWLDVFKIPKEFGFNGVAHSDELQFFFQLNPPFPPIQKYDILERFSSNLIMLWISFARKSQLNGYVLILIMNRTPMLPQDWQNNNLQWNPIQPSELSGFSPLKYLKIKEKPELIVEPFKDRLDFWDQLGI